MFLAMATTLVMAFPLVHPPPHPPLRCPFVLVPLQDHALPASCLCLCGREARVRKRAESLRAEHSLRLVVLVGRYFNSVN